MAVDERHFFENFADTGEFLWIWHGSRRRLLRIGRNGQRQGKCQQQAHWRILPVGDEVTSLKLRERGL